ncbi:MAG: glycosyltransferase family 2 protein [Lachnospiraceae bacterium]|nr:glycosyltransferase family 2 protein [Lachnospiraceae bacterium]
MRKAIDSEVKENIIVSLTSYPKRIGFTDQVIESLFRQTMLPDRITLWLSKEEFPEKEQELPDRLKKWIGYQNFCVQWCPKNLKSHKKYYYALQEYTDDVVITVDDDIIYAPDMIETLVTSFHRHPDAVSARQVRWMIRDQRKLLPYHLWLRNVDELRDVTRNDVCAVGAGGILYPPGCANSDWFDTTMICRFAFEQDDLWLKYQEVKKSIPVVYVKGSGVDRVIEGSQDKGLVRSNIDAGYNDLCMDKLMEQASREWPEEYANWFTQLKTWGNVIMEKYEENNKLLSVIITIYNKESYLNACIDSVLASTYKNLEVILVDDGSTDQSRQICEEYAEKDSRVRYIRIEHGGATAARKVGMETADGAFVCFVDGDDWVEPQMYENYVHVAEQEGADVVIGKITIHNASGERLLGNGITEGVYKKENREELLMHLLYGGRFSSGGIHGSLDNKLFRAEVIRPIEMDLDERIVYSEDAVVLYQCILESKVVAVTNLTGYHWVVRDGSLTHSKDADYLLSLHWLNKKMMELVSEYPVLENQIAPFMTQRLVSALNKEYDFNQSYEIHTKGTLARAIRPKAFYMFPFELVDRDSWVVLYGMGRIGKQFLQQLCHSNYARIVCIADSDEKLEGDRIEKYRIYSPMHIKNVDYDYIVISVANENKAMEIKSNLLDMNIPEGKIVWKKQYRI